MMSMQVSENYNVLSKGDLIALAELVYRFVGVDSDDALRELLLCTKRLVPVEGLVAAVIRKDGHDQFSIVERVVNVSYPPDWLNIYVERQYHKIDPIVRIHFERFQPQTWSITYESIVSREEIEFVNHSREYGLMDGITLGDYSLTIPVGTIFSFEGQRIPQNRRHIAVLEFLAPHIHACLIKNSSHNVSEAVRLSNREREVLQWAKGGKTNWEIGHILQISESAVVFHLHSAKRKLGARNRSQAVALALSAGLLDID